MHEATRIILLRAARKHNTLRPVRRSLCIMHQFAVGGTNRVRERDQHPMSLVGVGKFNRKPKTETKEPETGTERTETENFGS